MITDGDEDGIAFASVGGGYGCSFFVPFGLEDAVAGEKGSHFSGVDYLIED